MFARQSAAALQEAAERVPLTTWLPQLRFHLISGLVK